MSKVWTREELTALTKEQFEALSPEEQQEVITQGRAGIAQRLLTL